MLVQSKPVYLCVYAWVLWAYFCILWACRPYVCVHVYIYYFCIIINYFVIINIIFVIIIILLYINIVIIIIITKCAGRAAKR